MADREVRMPAGVLAVAGLALLTGCAATRPQTLYFWGSYEQGIYDAHARGETRSAHDQILALEADKAAAAGAARALPPGFHAHLGYLYFEDGQVDAARAELTAEKAAFPEATVFVDRLLANLGKPAGDAK